MTIGEGMNIKTNIALVIIAQLRIKSALFIAGCIEGSLLIFAINRNFGVAFKQGDCRTKRGNPATNNGNILLV